MSDVDKTLEERGQRYGDFKTHSFYTQSIKKIMMHNKEKWDKLSDSQRECLDMVAHKIGRILNGDPNYLDSWHDIAGYITLVENELKNPIQQANNGFSATLLSNDRESLYEKYLEKF